MRHRRRNRRARGGFTLIEILLVVMILAVIAGVVIRGVFGSQDQAYRSLAKTQISAFETYLKEYKLTMRSYPTSLEALHAKPNDMPPGVEWHQIMDKEISPDPWGNPYQYKVSGQKVEIRSAGPDGQMNSEDDITNT